MAQHGGHSQFGFRLRNSLAGGWFVVAPLVGVVFLEAQGVEGATLRVPFDYVTIAAAANGAVQGDSVLVWRPSPNGGAYENEQITLQQGVTLRGMEPDFYYLSLDGCVIHCLEASPIGADDTTRVEGFLMFTSEYMEAVQAYSPRTSVVECEIVTLGPPPFTGVRLYKGGVVTRSRFSGGFENNAITARQGTVVVAWNVFEGVLYPFSLYNEGAADPAYLSFRNNTVGPGYFSVEPGPDSIIEFVNNIFHANGWFECEDTWDIRYNDFYGTFPQCTVGVGNLFVHPMYCNDDLDLDPESPCVGSGENGMNMGAMGVCVTAGVETADAPQPPFRIVVQPNPVRVDAQFIAEGAGSSASLEIYDPQGRLIELMHLSSGQVRWQPSASAPRGIYFARLSDGERSDVVKFAFIK